MATLVHKFKYPRKTISLNKIILPKAVTTFRHVCLLNHIKADRTKKKKKRKRNHSLSKMITNDKRPT